MVCGGGVVLGLGKGEAVLEGRLEPVHGGDKAELWLYRPN